MNHDRWKHLANQPTCPDSCSMDWRHVQMIHAVLMNEPQMSVVEIGCGRGFSTSAIIEFLEANENKWAYLVDPSPTTTLREIIEKTEARSRIFLQPTSSKEYRGNDWTWIIDGDHREQAISDYENANESQARIIILHDTNPSFAPDHQFGSIEAGKRLLRDSVVSFHDMKERRNGEQTERGLSIGFFYSPKHETMEALRILAE